MAIKKNVAAVLVETLAAAGVERIYGVAGDSLNGITDSIRTQERLSWVHVRHEEAAAFAAGAEAHLTGRLTVCAGSCGPGNLHLINGLYDCHRSRVPVLAIAAQIPGNEIGSGYFQETHPEHLFAQCSYYCELISHPEQMPRVLEIAIQTAISRRGVAVVVLPGDVALREAVEQGPRLRFPPPHPRICPSDEEIATLAQVLNTSQKITILGGAGCADAHAELIELASKLKAPIVHAMRGKEYIEYDNPFDVGMTGLLGFSSGYYAMMACDVLLMIGTDFPYQQFFPKEATVIQIDRLGEQLGRRTRLDYGFVGDTKATLEALLPKLEQHTGEEHLRTSQDHYRRVRKGLDDLATDKPDQTPVHPQYVARVLNELAAEDAVFTCDVGTPTIWAARYLRMNGKRRLLGSFTHGSMANALPQAFGVQVSHPERQVIALSGDGGIAMLLGELLSLRQLRAPVKVIVFKNNSLAFVELEMKAAGILDFAAELSQAQYACEGLRYLSGELRRLLGVVVLTPQGIMPSAVRQGELETVLILLDELSQTAPSDMQPELRKLVTRLGAALPQLVLFAPALDELQEQVAQALGPQALHLLGWAWQRRGILGPSLKALLSGIQASWRPIAAPLLLAWEAAVRASSAVENWHSVLRPYLAVHRRLSSGMVALLAVWHNHRIAERGLHRGQSPLMRSGMTQASPDWPVALGYPPQGETYSPEPLVHPQPALALAA